MNEENKVDEVVNGVVENDGVGHLSSAVEQRFRNTETGSASEATQNAATDADRDGSGEGEGSDGAADEPPPSRIKVGARVRVRAIGKIATGKIGTLIDIDGGAHDVRFADGNCGRFLRSELEGVAERLGTLSITFETVDETEACGELLEASIRYDNASPAGRYDACSEVLRAATRYVEARRNAKEPPSPSARGEEDEEGEELVPVRLGEGHLPPSVRAENAGLTIPHLTFLTNKERDAAARLLAEGVLFCQSPIRGRTTSEMSAGLWVTAQSYSDARREAVGGELRTGTTEREDEAWTAEEMAKECAPWPGAGARGLDGGLPKGEGAPSDASPHASGRLPGAAADRAFSSNDDPLVARTKARLNGRPLRAPLASSSDDMAAIVERTRVRLERRKPPFALGDVVRAPSLDEDTPELIVRSVARTEGGWRVTAGDGGAYVIDAMAERFELLRKGAGHGDGGENGRDGGMRRVQGEPSAGSGGVRGVRDEGATDGRGAESGSTRRGENGFLRDVCGGAAGGAPSLISSDVDAASRCIGEPRLSVLAEHFARYRRELGVRAVELVNQRDALAMVVREASGLLLTDARGTSEEITRWLDKASNALRRAG